MFIQPALNCFSLKMILSFELPFDSSWMLGVYYWLDSSPQWRFQSVLADLALEVMQNLGHFSTELSCESRKVMYV